MGKALYHALRLAQELVGAAVPARVLREVRAGCGHLPLEARFLAAVARRALLAEAPATGLPLALYRLGMHLLATQRARDGVTVVGRLLARAGQGRLRRLGLGPGRWRAHVAGAGDSESSSRPQKTTARPTSQGEQPIRSQGEVAVTYDQNAADGVGAQLQRIYGLYALSRALDIKYVHTPLGRVDYQGLMPMLTGRTDPDFVTRYNAFFSLPSDDFDVDGCERVRVDATSNWSSITGSTQRRPGALCCWRRTSRTATPTGTRKPIWPCARSALIATSGPRGPSAYASTYGEGT